MSKLKSPLLSEELTRSANSASECLSALADAIRRKQDLNSINFLCEEMENRISDLRNFPAETVREKNEVQSYLNEYSQQFERLLEKVETSIKGNETGETKLKFADLQDDINRHTLEHAKKLQGNMVIVAEIMKDFSETVNGQGMQLDTIEVEVTKANKYTEKGTTELEKTDLRQRRKKKCCWIIMFVALAFLVGLIVVVVMIEKKR